MIELSILELLYLVLIFFLIIIGTLLSLVLIRVMKILRVGTEVADYYWQIKKLLTYYGTASYIMKDKIFDYFTQNSDSSQEDEKSQESKNPTEK